MIGFILGLIIGIILTLVILSVGVIIIENEEDKINNE